MRKRAGKTTDGSDRQTAADAPHAQGQGRRLWRCPPVLDTRETIWEDTQAPDCLHSPQRATEVESGYLNRKIFSSKVPKAADCYQ